MAYNEQALAPNFTLYERSQPFRAAEITAIISDTVAGTGADHAPFQFPHPVVAEVGWFILCMPDGSTVLARPAFFATLTR